MDWRMNETSVVIVGAGFSIAATNGALPLMRNYFARLSQHRHSLLHDFVGSVAPDVATANVERVLLSLDQIRTSPDGVLQGWADQWKVQISELHRQLADYTLERMRDSLQISGDNWAAQLLADCGPRTTVISMNYDNIAEKILSNRQGLRHGLRSPTCPHCKMRHLLMSACSCEGRSDICESDWRGAVIKPHGSIAWKRCLNTACCSFECLVADEHCQPFEPCGCPNCKHQCGPVLVMPTMSKNLSDTPEIGVMWQAARFAIAEAESILFFGFSMPSSDELLLQMIRQAIHQNRRLRRVASIDLEPEAVLTRFEACIPSDQEVTAIPLRVVPAETPHWLRTVNASQDM